MARSNLQSRVQRHPVIVGFVNAAALLIIISQLGPLMGIPSDPGLNPSLDVAGAELAERGVTRLLVVLGDVAGAEAADLGALFDALDGLGGRGVVLAPSRDGGTSALLRAPHAVIPNHFGKESAAAHRDLARSQGVPYSELPLPSLAIDLDRVEDVAALLRAERGADRTRSLLRELGFGSGS